MTTFTLGHTDDPGATHGTPATHGRRPVKLDLARLVDTRPAVADRFRCKVNYDGPIPEKRPDLGPCWLWTAATNGRNGYGIFRGGAGRDAGGSHKWILAHRYAYMLLVGPIPTGQELDHLCRNKLCVNPAHLEATSHQVNVLRSDGPSARQARRDRCVRGHPFDKIDRAGKRRCSICDREKELRRYVRRYGRWPKPQKARSLSG